MKLAPLSMLMRSRILFSSQDSTVLSVMDAELVIRGLRHGGCDANKQCLGGTLSNHPDLAKLADGKPRPEPLQHLLSLEEHLALEFTHLGFDYQGLEQRCWDLLGAAKKRTGSGWHGNPCWQLGPKRAGDMAAA